MATTDSRQPTVIDDQLQAQMTAATNGDWPAPADIAESRDRFIDAVWDLPARRVFSESDMEFITETLALETPDSLTLNDVYGLLLEVNDRAEEQADG